jgi:competence protein ComEA
LFFEIVFLSIFFFYKPRSFDMLKKILATLVMMYAAVSFAAVDVNKATAAELDAIKGIGPAISAKILAEKKTGGNFKDWDDLVKRVNGVGEGNAAKFSAEGLTVGGASFKGAAAPAKAADKPAAAKDAKDAKPAATTEKKAEDKKADAKPAAAAPAADKKADAKADMKADPKAEAKAKKEAAAKAKADAKKAKEDEAKAKKEAAAKAKAADAKPTAAEPAKK